MKKKLCIVIMLIIFLYPLNILAFTKSSYDDGEMILNPEWEYYSKLTDEEKSYYTSIPEPYINKYINKNKKNYNYFNDIIDGNNGLEDEMLPNYFRLNDVNGKRYVNGNYKNQGSLGLCWIFGAVGSAESNVLLKGVQGIDDEISKCDPNNLNTKSCRLKSDYEINQQYINGTATKNAEFSERIIDYIETKANYPVSIYNQSGVKKTIYPEGYNLYGTSGSIGDGGWFSEVAKYYSYGIVPLRMLNEWDTYLNTTEEKTLAQVFDSINNDYQVTEYLSFGSKPTNETDKKAWMNDLKKLIMKNGSFYIATTAPQHSSAGSCYYYDTTYTRNGVIQNIPLINYTGNSANCNAPHFGSHAMQLIGWDDDYTFAYCKVDGYARTTYTKETCEEAGYIWTSGTGAWILKNSWGNTALYPYLSYDSSISELYNVREVSTSNFDNSYNELNSGFINNKGKVNIDGKDKYFYERKFYKGSKNEYLTRINFTTSNSNKNVSVYVSENGKDYKFIETKNIDYVGMYSSNIDNYKLSSNEFYVRLVTDSSSSFSSINGFTINECTNNNNCDNKPDLNTVTNGKNFLDSEKEITIYTKTRNIASGSKLEFKLTDDFGNDLSSKISFTPNLVVENANVAKMTINETLPEGKYHLYTNYEDSSSIFDFNIYEEIFLELFEDKKMFLDDKTGKINYKISNNNKVSKLIWKSYDEEIASVDNNGILTLNASGTVTIELEAITEYGTITQSIDVNVYEKVKTIEDFFEMQSTENKYNAYYLDNDLDFTNVNFDDYPNSKNNFSAIFDGGFHTIKNVKRTDTTYCGLFNNLMYATITDLKIENSTFEGNTYVGSLAGMSYNSTIEGIYSNSIIKAKYYSGGILGYSFNDEINSSVFDGNASSISTTTFCSSGGITGDSYQTEINNCINRGTIHAESNFARSLNVSNYAAGITANSVSYSNTFITNNLNVGDVTATTKTSNVTSKSIGLSIGLDYIKNSYYLNTDNYTFEDQDNAKTGDELKIKSTFKDWDFDKTWEIKENVDYPNLKIFAVEAENVYLGINSKKLNTNETYSFSYNVEPLNYASDIKISSSDEELFIISDDKIITRTKEGTGKIIFNANGKIFEFEISVKNKMNINYNEAYTNKDLNVNIDANYSFNDVNGYLKLEYIGDNRQPQSIDFPKQENYNTKTLKITENQKMEINLYYCNEICELIANKYIDITNIDKIPPTINYETDINNNTLKITNIDSLSGFSTDNTYEFSISNNNILKPTIFNNYQSGIILNNISMNYINKYLWVKSFQDKAGNKLCDSEYCSFNMDIEKRNYKVFYYDEDGKTILYVDNYPEDSILKTTRESNKLSDSDEYYYEFDHWDNYTKGMTINKNIKLIAVYKKVYINLSSKTLKIDNNGYIIVKNKENIKDKYLIETFKNDLENNEKYHFYNKNNLADDLLYINTGLVYSNNKKKYKICLLGDVTGDGIIQINDIMKMATHIINGNILYDEYYISGDVTGDGKVQINDIMKIANSLVNGGGLK